MTLESNVKVTLTRNLSTKVLRLVMRTNHSFFNKAAFYLAQCMSFRYCGRPWPAAYINFNQNIHQIQVLTKPLCHAQAIFYSLPNNERGTKYRGLTYSAK